MQKDDVIRLRHMLDAAKEFEDLPPLIAELEEIIEVE